MTSSTSTKMKTLDMAYIGLFAVVIAICSWISIPTVVPFTLQTFAVFLAVAVLGGKRGTLSVIVYVLLGAVGLPVFSGFKGGIGVLLNTTEKINKQEKESYGQPFANGDCRPTEDNGPFRLPPEYRASPDLFPWRRFH